MDKHEIAAEEILKIDELCDKYPFTKQMVLDFAKDCSAEAAIYLMNEIIEENRVREEKKMGPIAHAATFRQRARQQKSDLLERVQKAKGADRAAEEEEARLAHEVEVLAARDSEFDPFDLQYMSVLVANRGAHDRESTANVEAGLRFLSSLSGTKVS